MQTLLPKSLPKPGNHRLVRYRPVTIVTGPRRLGGILTSGSSDAEEILGHVIVFFEVLVRDGPRRRHAFLMRQFFEVLFTQPEHRGAEELRVPADEVVLPRTIALAVAIEPRVTRAIPKLTEHGFRVPVLQFAGKIVSPLDHQDTGAGSGDLERNGAPAYARADDDDVCVHHAILSSVCASNRTSFDRSTCRLHCSPGLCGMSAPSRAATSKPPISRAASVSGPVGSMTSTFTATSRTAAGTRELSTPIASGRRPAMTFLPTYRATAAGWGGRSRLIAALPSPIVKTSVSFRAASAAGMRFIDGEPMNVATKVLAGVL